MSINLVSLKFQGSKIQGSFSNGRILKLCFSDMHSNKCKHKAKFDNLRSLTMSKIQVQYIPASPPLKEPMARSLLQGLKFPLVRWSVTTKTVSGPVELSLPLVHWTSNSCEKCHVFSQPTPQRQRCVFPWPRPLCIHNEQREMTVLHDEIKHTTQALRTQKKGFEKQSPSVSNLSLLQW